MLLRVYFSKFTSFDNQKRKKTNNEMARPELFIHEYTGYLSFKRATCSPGMASKDRGRMKDISVVLSNLMFSRPTMPKVTEEIVSKLSALLTPQGDEV